jgi:hypothetical protein
LWVIFSLIGEKGFGIWIWVLFWICLLLSIICVISSQIFNFQFYGSGDYMQVDLLATNISGFLASIQNS